MSFLDVRTVMLSHVLTDVVCTAVLAFLWVQNRKRFAGISYWVLDFAFQTAAVLLILLRGSIPAWVSMGVSNMLVVTGAFLGYMGLTRFVGKQSLQIHNYLLLAAFLTVHLYFIFAQPNLAARNLNLSLGLLVMSFQCVWLVLRRVEHGMRRMTLWVGLVFSVFCLVSLVRIVVVLVSAPTSNDFFRSGAYDTLLLMSYQMLLILLTFALALMINQRLLKEILTQEEKFTKAFRSSPYGITLTRPSDGQILDVNDGFAAITGYSYAEAVGRTALDLQLWVREVDRAAVVSELSRGNRVVGREYQFRKKSGELVTGLFTAEIIKINDQPWLLSSISDITEHKRVEEALRESERRLTEVQRIGKIGNWEWIPAENKVTWSAEMYAIFGITPETLSLTTEATMQAFHPEDRAMVAEATRKTLEELTPQIIDCRILKPDGTIVYVFGRGEVVLDANGKLVKMIGIYQDITERKLAEEEKAKLEGQLQKAQKMETVGQLAGGVAHDFNNMLQVITSYVELSLAKVDAAQPLHKYLLEIRRAAQRSAEITGQLLAFARKQTVSPKVLDLNNAVAHTQKMIQQLIGEDIDLAWMPGHDLWKVKIDPTQLDQILANLAVNARDAIGGVGKLTIETENVTFDAAYCATHAGFVPGENVLLAMSDDGCGMDKATLSHLFEPFFTTKGVGKGTGLGLATIYGIVKQNNGFINVYSEPGEGTTFKVYLPRAEGEQAIEQVEPEAPRGGTETVLVAEDEAAILELAREILEQLGYTVLIASSAEEAIRMSEEHTGPIQLLITDVVMPQINGRQLAQRLSAARPQLKCMYMSGYTADIIAHRGILDEGVSFIAKPFSLATLAEKVRNALDAPAGGAAPAT